ncbi:hypothetical protein ACEPPN_012229 [Leptodophora sp. 'Broadleaf-Isolate-01']
MKGETQKKIWVAMDSSPPPPRRQQRQRRRERGLQPQPRPESAKLSPCAPARASDSSFSIAAGADGSRHRKAREDGAHVQNDEFVGHVGDSRAVGECDACQARRLDSRQSISPSPSPFGYPWEDNEAGALVAVAIGVNVESAAPMAKIRAVSVSVSGREASASPLGQGQPGMQGSHRERRGGDGSRDCRSLVSVLPISKESIHDTTGEYPGQLDTVSGKERVNRDTSGTANASLAHPPLQHQFLPEDRHLEPVTHRSIVALSDFTQFTINDFASDSDLDFEDCLTPPSKSKIRSPTLKTWKAQAALYDAVRAEMARASEKTECSTSSPAPTQLTKLFTNTQLRIVEGTGNQSDKLNSKERLNCGTLRAAVAWAKEQCNFNPGRFYFPEIPMKMVNPNIYLFMDTVFEEQLIAQIDFPRDNTPHQEAEFRARFWDASIFVVGKGLSEVESKGGVIRRLVELRTKTVSKCSLPAISAKKAENSLSPADLSNLNLKGANNYIYFDIAYAVEAQDILDKYRHCLPQLFSLPVNRLFDRTSRRGHRENLFTCLPHFLIEVKPLSNNEDLILKATAYLTLNSSALLHDYMKLHWLATPQGSKYFTAVTPYIYLITAVGFTAKILCAHIRKFPRSDSKSKSSPNIAFKTSNGNQSSSGPFRPLSSASKSTPSLIRYEFVPIGS